MLYLIVITFIALIYYILTATKFLGHINSRIYLLNEKNDHVHYGLKENVQKTTKHIELIVNTKIKANVQKQSENQWMAKMEEKYRLINNRINSICQKELLKTAQNAHKSNSRSFVNSEDFIIRPSLLLDRKNLLGYCPNAKVGTTTWMRHFNLLNSPSKREEKFTHSGVNKAFKLPSMSEIKKNTGMVNNTNVMEILASFMTKNHVLTFSFVRHPFERLVSAYKDKILKGKDEKIKGSKFPLFIDKVLKEYHKDKTCHFSYDKPCFNIDRHWMPFSSRCMYCHISYNVIGTTMEDFSDDVRYIIIKQNLENFIPVQDSTLRISFSRDLKRDERKNETLMYFSPLKSWKIRKLLEMFRLDFDLFDFEVDSYISR